MGYRDASPDPKQKLTVEEFKKVFERFWDVLSPDKQIQRCLDVENLTLQNKIDEAVSATKAEIYKQLFWDRDRLERPDYDP